MKLDYILNEKEYHDRTDEHAESPETILDDLRACAQWLSTHNKNYTNKQYYKICHICDILESIDTE